MSKFNLIVTICFILSVSLPQTWSRKYNIEAEAMRLYGEDLKSVLRRFRRTPEYLQLLEEKDSHIQLMFSEVFMNALQYVKQNRLKKKVALVCGIEDNFEQLEPTLPDLRFGNYKSPVLREGEDPEMPWNRTKTLSPVETLDHYQFFTSPLSVKERNKIRDIGFESAGETIHMMIRGMGPMEFQSTRQPYGGELEQHIRTTTEKDHRHLISTQAPPFDHEDDPKYPESINTPVDDILRGFRKKIRLGPF